MDILKLGGREFTPLLNGTIEHDYWLMGRIRLAGLDVVAVEPGEEADEFAMRVLRDAINSGQVFDLLGGMLLPVGMDPAEWTPDMATSTGDFIKRLTNEQDKQAVNNAVLSLLFGFFENGLASLVTSRRYSSSEASPPAMPVNASEVH